MDLNDERRPRQEAASQGADRATSDRSADIVADAHGEFSLMDWPGLQSANAIASHLIGVNGVVELRALNVGGGTVSWYCTDSAELVVGAYNLDGKASAIYVTLNPPKAELCSRTPDGAVKHPKQTTADNEIERRTNLLVDLDPVRPSGLSATDAEKSAALELTDRVEQVLTERGWPAPLAADSGNGGHLTYRVELPTDDQGLIQKVLWALGMLFDREDVTVDQKVFNPARITKFYGTMACKGENTPERPHRRSSILRAPAHLRPVTREQLEALVRSVPSRPGPMPVPPQVRIDIDAYLRKNAIKVRSEKPWQGGRRFVLEQCVWDPAHTDRSAYVVQFVNGGVAAGCHHNSCQGKGWKEFVGKVDPSTAVSVVSGVGGASENSWPDPQPIVSDLPPVAPFRLTLIPETCRAWIIDIAERMQCPLDFLAIALMVAIAGAVGRRIGIRPKRKDSWLVVANLWGMVIGRPGILKTPAVDEVLKPLRRLEIEARKRFKDAMAEHRAAATIAGEKLKVAKEMIRKAVKDGLDPEEVAQAEMPLELEMPVCERHLVNDSTVEKLGELHNENPFGLLVYRDELIGWLYSLDREGQEAARSFYLEAWNGTGSFTYDRIGRGTVFIKSVTLSIIGCTQPGPISQYLRGAIQSTAEDDGLIQRFQLAVWPDLSKEWKNVDRWPDKTAKENAHQMFVRLSRLTAEEVGAEHDATETDGIPFLRFERDAQELFDQYRTELERRIRSDTEHPAIESHISKYRSLVPSIALLLHLADGNSGPVQIQYVRMAIEWADYLESHARRIYSVAINAEMIAAKALSKKLIDGSVKDKFVLRDIYRKGWTGLSSREDVEKAVRVLVDLDWLAETKEQAGTAQRLVYTVNPKVRGMKSQTPPEGTDNADSKPDQEWGAV